MNIDKSEAILDLVNGDPPRAALATIALALIYVCVCLKIPKREMLASLSAQWDEHHEQRRLQLS
jgi:hypothetical protein